MQLIATYNQLPAQHYYISKLKVPGLFGMTQQLNFTVTAELAIQLYYKLMVFSELECTLCIYKVMRLVSEQ